MRIVPTQPPRELISIGENGVFRQVQQRPDSIESLNAPTWIFAKARLLYRRVLDFFRRIFSRFLPIEPYTPVSKKRIEYFRTVEEHRKIYRVLIDGVSSENEIVYSIQEGAVVISNISFPDQAMRAHIGSLFDEILEKEGAECFSTNVFDFAKLLWNCGYLAEGAKISYAPDSENMNQLLLGNLIDLAKERRESLPEDCKECAARVVSASESMNLASSIMGSFIDLGPSKKDLLLSDVLHLLDCLKIDKVRGVTFDHSGKGWVKFRKTG